MAENVGQYLEQYSGGLGSTTDHLLGTIAKNHRKLTRINIQNTKELLALPPTKFSAYFLFQDKADGGDGSGNGDNSGTGGLQWKIIRFNMLVPTFVMVDDVPLRINKAEIKSHFEAFINKKFGVENTTDVHTGAEFSGGFLPKGSIHVAASMFRSVR